MAEEDLENPEEEPKEPEREPSEESTETYECPDCGKEFGSEQALNSHIGQIHKEEEETEGVGEEEGLKPPEVEFIDTAIEKLKSQLPSVYGISDQRARNIIGTLQDNPSLLQSPQTLYMHIKQLASQANDYHLSIIINSIFEGQQQPSPQQPPMLFGQQQPQPQGVPPIFPPFQQQGTNPYVPQPYQGGQTNPQAQQLQQAQTQERIQQSREEHDLRMKKLEQEIKETSKGEEKEKVPVEFGDTTIQVPADLAPLYLMQQQESGESEQIQELRGKIEEERKEREKAERESLRKEIEHLRDEVENQPSLAEQIQSVEALSKRMGYSRTGMSTIDLLNQGISRMDKRAKQLLQRMPPGGEEGFEPEISRTPNERRRKAEQIEKQMERSDELIEAENALIEAASKVR